jgi:hypothetical protein
MQPYQHWLERNLEVRTFGSTDAGVSFWLRADGLTIFHAGDLNWWRWSGETQAEQDFAATKAFREKVAGTGLATVEISRKGQVFFFP